MKEVSAPITFSRKIGEEVKDLIVPPEFVRDFHYSTDEHLMIILRIMGPDLDKAYEFFKGSENKIYKIDTVETLRDKKISDHFRLNSMYLDEGPPISVDIDTEPEMIRLIMDFVWVR
ncbi:MAG: hypothetical protein ACP5C3_09600 [Methanomicrobiales archaeon]